MRALASRRRRAVGPRATPARPSSVTFVIMAGGKGERLWPLVRAGHPKVCLSPDGTTSLLQATIERLRAVWPGAGWRIVTTQEQAPAIRVQLPHALRGALLIEPEGKNTAACLTLAAAVLAARDLRGVMVAVPADHWIGDVAAFQRAMRSAIRAAVRHQALVTIGIVPASPHAGFGYLCAGKAVRPAGGAPSYRLKRFIEKPSVALARRLLRRPRTYWNSGIFIGTCGQFLACIAAWLPEHARRLVPVGEDLEAAPGAPGRHGAARRAAAAYRAVKAVSFDHGVMNHLRDGVVVEGRFAWADLGSWEAWAKLRRASSPTVGVRSDRITVVSQGRHLVATVGVRNLLVVHTPSVTLVCPTDRTQAVRDLARQVAQDRRLAAFR